MPRPGVNEDSVRLVWCRQTLSKLRCVPDRHGGVLLAMVDLKRWQLLSVIKGGSPNEPPAQVGQGQPFPVTHEPIQELALASVGLQRQITQCLLETVWPILTGPTHCREPVRRPGEVQHGFDAGVALAHYQSDPAAAAVAVHTQPL